MSAGRRHAASDQAANGEGRSKRASNGSAFGIPLIPLVFRPIENLLDRLPDGLCRRAVSFFFSMARQLPRLGDQPARPLIPCRQLAKTKPNGGRVRPITSPTTGAGGPPPVRTTGTTGVPHRTVRRPWASPGPKVSRLSRLCRSKLQARKQTFRNGQFAIRTLPITVTGRGASPTHGCGCLS